MSATKSIYIASRYSRHPEMRGVRDVLVALGYQVTSRWIDMHGGKYPDSFTVETLNDDPEYIVGPREHIFHTLPQVEHYPNWSRLVMALTPASRVEVSA